MWKEENENYAGQGHRRNMLSANYKSIGIACVKYNGCYYWTMELCSSSSGSAATTAVDTSKTMTVEIADSVLTVNSVSCQTSNTPLTVGEKAVLPSAAVSFVTTETWPSSVQCSGSQSINWISSNESIAAIADGCIIANKIGTATISGKLINGNTVSFMTIVHHDGDVDCNETINILDARLAKRIAMKDAAADEYTLVGLTAGDLDNNGKITINEARKIKRVVLGLTTL